MLIIGCDYHPGFQQIAFVDTDTGEAAERRLTHREEAEQFYRALQARRVRIGMEASGHSRWFERLLKRGDVSTTGAKPLTLGVGASLGHPIAKKWKCASQQRNRRNHKPTDYKMTHKVNGIYPMATDTGSRHY